MEKSSVYNPLSIYGSRRLRPAGAGVLVLQLVSKIIIYTSSASIFSTLSIIPQLALLAATHYALEEASTRT